MEAPPMIAPARLVRRVASLRPSPLTWGLVAAAAVSVTWAHLDARRGEAARATLVSTRAAAFRVLPELANLAADGATVELWPPHGAPVRLVPGVRGHAVWLGDEVLGPADPEAMEGVWDSLRLATTVRAADGGSEAGLGGGGRIVVMLPGGGGTRTIVLGRPTVDGAGHYGAVEGGAEGTEGLWVLEEELSVLVQQAPEAWLARRALVIEPAEVSVVRAGELVVERGLDGLWRARLGEPGARALLDRVAVQTRIDRLVSARLDPLVAPVPGEAGEPLVVLEGHDGVDHVLRGHGPCPGRPDRVLVDRGPGRWGCLDAALAQPWPVPGRDVPDPGALLEPRLLPHAYGRVLRLALRRPTERVLSRYGGGWRIEEDAAGRTAVFDVSEPEVYRWYQALHEAEVSLAPADEAWPPAPDVELVLTTDSTMELRLRCAGTDPLRCRRDDGPVVHVRSKGLPALAFDLDAFAERRLTEVRSEDVRALEVLPGPAGPAVVRQSLSFDLGVWRLDAPAHPEGDAALDSLRLEALLGAVGGLRAEAWVDAAADVAAERRIRVERVPRRGQAPVLEIELLPDCVVRVSGQRPGRIGEGACEALRQDLLVEQPLLRPIDIARGLEVSQGGGTTRLDRRGGTWVDAQGSPVLALNAWLQRLSERRATALVSGSDPPGPRTWQLRVLPAEGTAFVFEGGPAWVRVAGQGWYYRLADEDDAPADEDDDVLGDE
jgi:hypothetical protein